MARRFLYAVAFLVILSAAATTQVPAGPAHYWTFDEASGVEVLDSVGGVTGTMTATVTRVPGVVGAGAIFVAPTNQSLVSFGPSIGQFGTDDFSFSLWIRTNEAGHSDVVGTRIDGTFGNYVQVRLDANHTEVAISETLSGLNFAVAAGRPISDSQWHLLSVRRQGTALSLFVDGQLEQTVHGAGVADVGVAGRDFRIGFSLTQCCAGFHSAQMEVDDFKIWDRALPDAEVAAMHFATPPQDPLPGGNPPPPPVCGALDPATITPVQLVKDFNNTCSLGTNASSGIFPLRSNDTFAFLRLGSQLWRTGGTEETTVLVKAFTSLSASMAASGDRFLFYAEDPEGDGLWVSDGTADGTTFVAALPGPPGNFTPADNRVFFTATTPAEGNELWVTDGTTAGTGMVADLRPGTLGSNPQQLKWALGRLWFSSATPARELWVTDGTASGTTLVADLNGTGSGTPSTVAAVGDRVVFHAVHTGVGRELFITDGTPEGTSLLMDIRPGTGSGFAVLQTPLFEGQGRVMFAAIDGITGIEPWTTDGTPGGTVPLGDLNPGTGSSVNVGPALFTAGAASTPLAGKAYFTATNPTHGSELWTTDGTPAGTSLVADISPGAESSTPQFLTAVGDRLFFRASVGADAELYSTDGTAEGTGRVVDLNPVGSSGVSNLLAVGRHLLFTGQHPSTGIELWSLYVDGRPSIALDTTPDGAAGWTRTSPAIVTVAASDPDDESVAPSCTVNDLPATVAGDTLEISTQGAHVVVCSVTDSAGQTASASLALKIDSIAPILTITHDPDGPSVNPPVTVTVIVADEGGSPIGSPACYLDGVPAALTPSGGGHALTLTDEGVYEIECTVADEAGNPGAASVTVTIDTDQDDDGVPDADDAFPLDATETADADGDGIGNNADADDDGDGTADATDAFPLDATESVDTDGDGIGNNADTDDDDDGVPDVSDPSPLTQPADTSAEAVASLEALLTSASGSDVATIERAIDYLASSTASTFWVDASHLSEDGDRVLQDLHQALVKLSAVADPEPELVAVMAAIAGITRNVAAVIIADAIAAHGATPQSDAALRALADGDAAIQAGYFKAAQTAYTIAWRQGTNAAQ